MTINEIVALASMLISVGMNVGLYIHLSSTMNTRFDSFERRMNARFDSVERRLEMIQGDIHQMDIRNEVGGQMMASGNIIDLSSKRRAASMSLTDEDKQWINAQFEAVHRRIAEANHDLETKLPTEFHKWASPVEMRARSHSAALRAIDVEMESVSDRVVKLGG